MAVVCGHLYTGALTSVGELWVFGKNSYGQLGVGTHDDYCLPTLLNFAPIIDDDLDVNDTSIVFVSLAKTHAACVTEKGNVFTWGNNMFGQLGFVSTAALFRPTLVYKETQMGSRAIMVSCGDAHTLVLLDLGCILSCGNGSSGQLGHGDRGARSTLYLVESALFTGNDFVMVEAGAAHSMALDCNGGIFTWGNDLYGQLGHGHINLDNTFNEHSFFGTSSPKLIDTSMFGEDVAVQIAAGSQHSAIITKNGNLWCFGDGRFGQLGLGNILSVCVPTHVGGAGHSGFAGSQAVLVRCGCYFSLVLTDLGSVWTFGMNEDGALGHNDYVDRSVPTLIEMSNFDNRRIVSLSGGTGQSAAVTDQGTLYTWGSGNMENPDEENGLGHLDKSDKLLPTLIEPRFFDDARIGRFQNLLPSHMLAFAMGTHAILGGAVSTRRSRRQRGKSPAIAQDGLTCLYQSMPSELIRKIIEAGRYVCPAYAGKYHGIRRVLGDFK